MAKQVATTDHLSGGRFLFGVGAGWLVEELLNHGVEPALRWDVMGEQIRAMKAIWTQPEPEFHGRHVNFDPILLGPKPVQRAHPPMLVGGNGPRALRMAAQLGDGWMPVASWKITPVLSGLDGPSGLAFDGHGSLYVADAGMFFPISG